MALLVNHRHRPEDLAHWRQREIADHLNYRLREMASREQRVFDCLRRFIAAGRCYLACSFGKDSLTIAHLLWRLGKEWAPARLVPIYRVHMPGIETPGTDEVEAVFLERFPLLYQRVTVEHDPRWVRQRDRMEEALILGIARCRELAGTPRWIGGLRAVESAQRAFSMRRGGIHGPQCSPLASWRPEDIFAYLARHDLPVHPNYAMTGGGFWERDHLRVCMLGNHRGRQMGRLLWEEWYYGDVLDAMRAIHPNMVPEG